MVDATDKAASAEEEKAQIARSKSPENQKKLQFLFFLHHACQNMIMDAKMLAYLQYMDNITYTKMYGRMLAIN